MKSPDRLTPKPAPGCAPTRRRALLASALATLAPVGAVPAWAQAPSPAPSAARPKLDWPALTTLDGQPWQAPGLASAPAAVVVVFWLTTCPFCARHNAHVEKLHRRAQADGRALRVLTLAADRSAADVSAYMARHGYTFPVAREYETLRRRITERRGVVPLTAVIDRDRSIREVIPGEMFEEDLLDFLRLHA